MGLQQSKTSVSKYETHIGIAVAKLKDKRTECVHSTQCLTLKFPKLKAGLRKAKELFHQIDSAHDGNIDLKEFHLGCPLLGISATHPGLRDIWKTADQHHDRKLNFPEFVLALQLVHLLEPEEALKSVSPEIKAALDIMEQAFCYFDSTGDGVISVSEIATAVKRTGSRRVLQAAVQPTVDKPLPPAAQLRKRSIDLLANVVHWQRPEGSVGGSSPKAGDFWGREQAPCPAPVPLPHEPEHKMGHQRRQMDPVAVKLFKQLDADHNGKISFGEFIVGLVELVMEDEEEENKDDLIHDQ